MYMATGQEILEQITVLRHERMVRTQHCSNNNMMVEAKSNIEQTLDIKVTGHQEQITSNTASHPTHQLRISVNVQDGIQSVVAADGTEKYHGSLSNDKSELPCATDAEAANPSTEKESGISGSNPESLSCPNMLLSSCMILLTNLRKRQLAHLKH